MKNSEKFENSFINEIDNAQSSSHVELNLLADNYKDVVCNTIFIDNTYLRPMNVSSRNSIYDYSESINKLFFNQVKEDKIIILNEVFSKPSIDILVLDIYIISNRSSNEDVGVNKIITEISRYDERNWGRCMEEFSQEEKDIFRIKLSHLCSALRMAEFMNKNKSLVNDDFSEYKHFGFPFNSYDNRGD